MTSRRDDILTAVNGYADDFLRDGATTDLFAAVDAYCDARNDDLRRKAAAFDEILAIFSEPTPDASDLAVAAHILRRILAIAEGAVPHA